MHPTKQKGMAAELVCAQYLTNLGYDFCFPFIPGSKWDVLVEFPEEGWKKIQVKSCYRRRARSGIYVDIRTVRSGKKITYKEHVIDYLFAYDHKERDCYIIPWQELKNLSVISVTGPRWKVYRSEIIL